MNIANGCCCVMRYWGRFSTGVRSDRTGSARLEGNRLVEGFFNQMVLEYQVLSERCKHCSRLILVMAAVVLLVLGPGLAWALREGDGGCPTSNANPPAEP